VRHFLPPYPNGENNEKNEKYAKRSEKQELDVFFDAPQDRNYSPACYPACIYHIPHLFVKPFVKHDRPFFERAECNRLHLHRKQKRKILIQACLGVYDNGVPAFRRYALPIFHDPKVASEI
jgi:hypothetical protein